MISVTARGSETTAVVFSGLAPLNHIYEWSASFRNFPINLIGVRDPHECWYQRTLWPLCRRLRTAIAALGTRRLVCVGGSAGGFAALLFGRALGADRILAFCPQSACGAAKRSLGDGRWRDHCDATPSADIAGRYPGAVVHYADDPLDAMHAGRLEAKRLRWPYGGHDLPRKLKEDGLLQGVLSEAMA